ncbi:ABC transporter permease [Segeticoccus sp.]|uniref:ABC transporter permease n=1 Tax=Segeticoccus sp. TaxID=2706531 RepID=UPI002D7F2C04|nr:ABC transporter permease [Segeticoccus sp.]
MIRPKNVGLIVASVVLAFEVVAMIAPGLLTTHSPVSANASQVLLPPSSTHWLGTEANGVDMFSRIVYATRTDLLIALICVAVAMVAGGLLGVFAGYVRNFLSEGLMRLLDFLQSFPIFILALAFVAIRGQSRLNVMIVLSLLFIPVIARLVRAEALATSEKAYVRISRHLGVGARKVMLGHVLPNSLGSSVIQMSVNAGLAVLLTADLGFIGAGVRPPTPEWGADAASGAQQLLIGKWWASVFPGVAIILTVWALSYLSIWFGNRFIAHRSRPRTRIGAAS